MKTEVISLWGGPGTGKSTAAAKVFAALKERGENVELVREYAKELVWQGTKLSNFDQWLFLGIQVNRETSLFGKVSHIVTDSPFLMGAMYAERYHAHHLITRSAYDLYTYIQATTKNVHYRHILLAREKPYNTAGRYETEEDARDFDRRAEQLLCRLAIPYEKLTSKQLLESL